VSPGLDPHRAAEVITPAARGSGYLVADGVVLTAAHVVVGSAAVRVRFDADQPTEWIADAVPAWSDSALDTAVLRITSPARRRRNTDTAAENGDPAAGTRLATNVPLRADPDELEPPADPFEPDGPEPGGRVRCEPVRYGRIVRPPVPCEALGFPLFKMRYDPGGASTYRDSEHAVGTATSWSNMRESTVELRVGAPERDPSPRRSPWEGMSGAAVFSGDVLIGVVGEHHRTDGPGTLAAYRVDAWYSRLSADRLGELANLIGLPPRSAGLAEVAPKAAAWPVPPLRQLPADTSAFTNRGRELATLLGLLDDGAAPMIAAIDGMGGIGKTALAVRAAHELAASFPDRHLFLDLHGYTAGLRPREPAEALASVLRSLGVPPQRIPAELDARAALYRDRLAGGRNLVVLDNAVSETQIRLLLPAAPGSLVLITSRRRLRALDDAIPISLDLLPTPDAATLFRRVAGRARFPADDPLLPEVAALCGHLPLAVRIAAALSRHRPAWTLGYLVDRLRAETALSDGERSLATVFDLSYDALRPDQRRLYRRLGLVPGPDADKYAAAALLDADPAEAERWLQDLVDHNLLAEPAPGRYEFHDLLRAHARAHAAEDDPPEDRAESERRLLSYYQEAAQRADRHLTRYTTAYRPGADRPHRHLPPLDTREEADVWFRHELPNLTAAARHFPAHAAALAAGLNGYLRVHGPWSEAVGLHTAAAEAARAQGDRAGQATALTNLGTARRLTGDHAGAAHTLDQALVLFSELGDDQGRANALDNLAAVHWRSGRYPDAVHAYAAALELCIRLRDARGQASALTGLGVALELIGEYHRAEDAHRRALAIYRDLDDRRGQAAVLAGLGIVMRGLSDHPAAISTLTEAATLAAALQDRQGQAIALVNLGAAHRMAGDPAAAEPILRHALALFEEVGYGKGQAHALTHLSHVHRLTGDLAEAIAAARQATAGYAAIADYGGEAQARIVLAHALAATGTLAEAEREYTEALRLARQISSPRDESESLAGLANLRRDP
jgi:tetratricopeptide (TPR) repeat protein